MNKLRQTCSRTAETKTEKASLQARRHHNASCTSCSYSSLSLSRPLDRILSLQRSIGNLAVGELLRSLALQAKLTTSSFHLQRTPDKKAKRKDVVVLGEGWEGGEELSRVLVRGGKIIRVKSVEEATAQLAKISFPIGALYIVTHSAARGALRFGTKEGWIEPADIAGKLKGVLSADNAPDVVDFRGCSLGTSPKAMNQVRAALGAKSVIAGNCYAVINRSTPIKIGGKAITKASDVTAENRDEFERLMKKTADKFGEEKKCILNRSEKGFFAAGGRFVALFFNPEFTGKWIPGKSVCYTDVTPEAVDPDKTLPQGEHCRIIKVDTPSQSIK